MKDNKKIDEKLEKLKKWLRSLKRVVIAFSGGVDSTFLAKVAYDVLHDNAIAVTATSSTYSKREFEDAKKLAKLIGIKHIIIESEETEIEGYKENPIDRCYYCKSELFSKLNEIAKKENAVVLDGSNFDDLSDYRPGMKAVEELNVRSPLKDAGLTKQEIRELSKQMDLPTHDKPAIACLASRFPYGTEITKERLAKIEKAEDFLKELRAC